MKSALRSLLMLTFAVAGSAGGFAVAAGPSASPAVPADIRAIFDKPLYKNATWGLRVLDGSKIVIDLNSDRQMYIGSVRKVFTIGQLLNTVGADHTYDTPVYHTGTIDGGVLHGNLIVVASGDLTMGGRTNPDGSIAVSDWDHNEADSLGNAVLTKPNPLAGYLMLARNIKASGITRIAGNVVIDDRLFPPYYFREQFNVRPIFVNDDLVDLSIKPGGKPGDLTSVVVRPLSAALKVDNQLHNGAPSSKKTLALKPEVPTCIGTPNCAAAIAGALPANFIPPLTGKPVLVQAFRIADPTNYARTVVIESLKAAGVRVDMPLVQKNAVALLPPQDAYRPDNKVTQLTGMRYDQDAKLILKISYNIGADTSLLLYGVAHHVNTMDAALKAERQELASRYGIESSAYHFVDGSGGGDTSATNVAVTKMLTELAKSTAATAFMDALPILAVDGSLGFVKDFQKNASLKGATGNVRAKTGTWVSGGSNGGMSLKGQAFGGYITTKSGHKLVYQLVVNNVPVSKIDDITTVFQDEGTISAVLWRDL